MSPSSSASLALPQPKPAKRKKTSRDDVDEALLRSLKDIEEMRAKRAVDENDLFGKHVSAVLHRFTPRQQAQARLRIEQVLVDVEFPEETHAYNNMHYSANMTPF